jgi:bifunctional enzyme CysN/CysC
MPSTVRLVLCGSVDDGKSTLIGRILYDRGQVFADEMRRVAQDSRRHGTQGDAADLALLVDGLEDERQQGITIDVAYRSFETARRRFVVADAPGHEQYTRNMATGASTADVAVVMADARKGVLPQTARHTRIAAMFGVRQIVLAVNKMDLVGWSPEAFQAISLAYGTVADATGIENVTAIPVSALTGDNLTRRSDKTPWYDGPTLLGHLETVEVGEPGRQGGVPDAGTVREPAEPGLSRVLRKGGGRDSVARRPRARRAFRGRDPSGIDRGLARYARAGAAWRLGHAHF